ncbi:MAG: uroporphyrinogen decarboxylase family protein [Oscillospiraceae bacterium]
MARPAFSKDEFKIVGMYPGVERFEVMGGKITVPESPIYNRPITQRENWKLLFDGKKPYWIPETGWIFCDQVQFRPRINPDNVANHQIFDGGPSVDYDKFGKVVHSSWFDLDWEWEYAISGATVRPGNPKVLDINHWEDYVSIPDLDALDWDLYKKENDEYLKIDKLRELGIQMSLWERLMCLMDVDNAAIALIDEDQKMGVHRFFDRLCDFYDDYIGRMSSLFDFDCVYLHDDWAYQRGTFFSIDTAREMLLPYLKRVVESAHKRGLYFEHHSCGKAESLVPVMIEAGVDMWCGQPAINDQDMLAQKYKNEPIVIGVGNPPIPNDATDEQLRDIAKGWVDRYKDCRVAAVFGFAPNFAQPAYQKFRNYVYEYSRIAFQNYD